MHPWQSEGIVLAVITAAVIGLTVTAVRFLRRRSPRRRLYPALAAWMVLLCAAGLFRCSHRTYWRYNDWAICGSSICTVRERWGEFDLCSGDPAQGGPGVAAYYIYTDNAPVMPDHLPHYYYLHYDTQGVVDAVWDAPAPGG